MSDEKLRQDLPMAGKASVRSIIFLAVQFCIFKILVNENLLFRVCIDYSFALNNKDEGGGGRLVMFGLFLIAWLAIVAVCLLAVNARLAKRCSLGCDAKRDKSFYVCHKLLVIVLSFLLVSDFIFLPVMYMRPNMFLSVLMFAAVFSPTIAAYVYAIKGFFLALSLHQAVSRRDKHTWFAVAAVSDDVSGTYTEHVRSVSRERVLFFGRIICCMVLFFLFAGVYGQGYESAVELKDVSNVYDACKSLSDTKSTDGDQYIIVPHCQFDISKWTCCGRSHAFDEWHWKEPQIKVDDFFVSIPAPGKEGWVVSLSSTGDVAVDSYGARVLSEEELRPKTRPPQGDW